MTETLAPSLPPLFPPRMFTFQIAIRLETGDYIAYFADADTDSVQLVANNFQSMLSTSVFVTVQCKTNPGAGTLIRSASVVCIDVTCLGPVHEVKVEGQTRKPSRGKVKNVN